MGDFIEIYDTEILLLESQYGDVIEMVGSAIILLPSSGSGSGGAVNSVNGKAGNVVLTAADVNADVAGSAQAVSDVLQPQIMLNTDAVAMLTALLSALQSAKADVSYVNQQIATLVGTDTQTLAAIQAISDALADNEDLLSALDQTVANRVRFDVSTQGLTALQKYNARTNIGAEESGTAALLISQITAASIGAATTAQLALKQDKLPNNGTAGQFLASDLTWKTPAGGTSSNEPVWTDVTILTANGWASGLADTTNKLQLGKDSNGYIWLRGVFRNTNGAANAGLLFNLPTSHRIKMSAGGFTDFYLTHVQFSNLWIGTASGGYLRITNLDATTQTLYPSASQPASSVLFIAPVVIGPAANP